MKGRKQCVNPAGMGYIKAEMRELTLPAVDIGNSNQCNAPKSIEAIT